MKATLWKRWVRVLLIAALLVATLSVVLVRLYPVTALVLFIRAADVPADAEDRLTAMVRGDAFKTVTVPFVRYLYDLYGAPATTETEAIDDLRYDEPETPVEEAGGRGLSQLVRQSVALRRHVGTALRLFDALFLAVKPGTAGTDVRERFDDAALEEIKSIFREVAAEMLPKSDAALDRETEENEYVRALSDILNDDQRLTGFVEFFTDFIRDLSDSWQRSFERKQERQKQRVASIEEILEDERFSEIVDLVRARSERRMAVHVVVDGLQGKLLEGLVQLSSGDSRGSGARYVKELVDLHRNEAAADPPESPGIGKDVRQLAENAPNRPDYLQTFKKYFFSPGAPAVTVSVATVDTPSISVRNLPIAQTGCAVAGRFGTGVPNFSYLDRQSERGWYFWGSDVLYLRDIVGNREDRIPRGRKRPGQGARTLFERLPELNTVSCMATLDTGALEKISSEVGVAVGELERNFIEKAIILRFRERARMERELNERRRWLMEPHDLSDRVVLGSFRDKALYLAEHEDEGLPDYVLWFNPWPDHFAHSQGPYSDAIIGYRGEYDRLDFYLGKLIEVYESVKTTDGRSTYAERTLFGLASDHGLIYSPKHVKTDAVLFGEMEAAGIRVSVLKLTHDEGELPAIHGRDDIARTRPFDAVVGSTAGGSYVIDLFDIEGLKGDDTAWQRHPGYHELRRHRLLSDETRTVDWIGLLKEHLAETMDLALVREYGPSAGARWPPEQYESVVRIVAPGARGEARIYRIRDRNPVGRDPVRYRYETLGGDPLDLIASVREYLIPPDGRSVDEVRAAIQDCIDSPDGCEGREWQELLSYTLRPDCVHTFSQLYDSERAGTVNVFPVREVGMNSEVVGRHAGESFGEKNGTQLYFGAGLQRAWIQTARNGSVPVTLYHWLVGNEVFSSPDPESRVAPRDQFGYPSLLDEPAFAPIR